jgi:hypothetical protein
MDQGRWSESSIPTHLVDTKDKQRYPMFDIHVEILGNPSTQKVAGSTMEVVEARMAMVIVLIEVAVFGWCS